MSLFKKIWKIAFINDSEGFFPKFFISYQAFLLYKYICFMKKCIMIYLIQFLLCSQFLLRAARQEKTCEAKSDEILKGVTEKNLQALIHFITLLEKEKLHKYVYQNRSLIFKFTSFVETGLIIKDVCLLLKIKLGKSRNEKS